MQRHTKVVIITLLISTLNLSLSAADTEPPQVFKAGLSVYYSQPKKSFFSRLLGNQASLPNPQYRTTALKSEATPTNQWYSSVLFSSSPAPIYAQPVTYKATKDGLELGLPDKEAVPVQGNQSQVLADSLEGKKTKPDAYAPVEIRYRHKAAITISPTAFAPSETKLSQTADWSIKLELGQNDNHLTATLVHGSPFSYYTLSKGDARFTFPTNAHKFSDLHDPRMTAFTINDKSYAIFAPTSSKWEWKSSKELILHLPRSAHYFSVAALPDNQTSTATDFLHYAYAFVRDTRVDWNYDEKNSALRTTYSALTEAKEGTNTTPLIGLYPHQWRNQSSVAHPLYEYNTVRGKIRLLAANHFTTKLTYHGIMPFWGKLQDEKDNEWLNSVLIGDNAKASSTFARQYGRGTYWTGKGLGALTQLMSIAEQQGNLNIRNHVLALLKQRMESWFSGKSSQTYFVYDKHLGTLIGYPEEFGNISAMNDHHFHYGYWIQAAAQIALRDPEWASKDKWGGLIDLMVADIATDKRKQSDFPFLRNFDLYEGHSWASGNAQFADGNNQESSSEAMNAWAGLILWGSVTDNNTLRNLGIYLYTTEAESIADYWFDVHKEVLAPEYGKKFASMVFGGKYAYNTWWTDEPRQIHGINVVPITPASLYLGQYPAYIKSNVSSINEEKHIYSWSRHLTDGTPPDIWQDILCSYLALSDPEAALTDWNPKGSVELGETRSHTLYWLLSLKEMGTPDFAVTANTPLYSVFKDKGGVKTYLVFNASDTPINVLFSDGKSVQVSPKSFFRDH